jgi:hypothetical protein
VAEVNAEAVAAAAAMQVNEATEEVLAAINNEANVKEIAQEQVQAASAAVNIASEASEEAAAEASGALEEEKEEAAQALAVASIAVDEARDRADMVYEGAADAAGDAEEARKEEQLWVEGNTETRKEDADGWTEAEGGVGSTVEVGTEWQANGESVYEEENDLDVLGFTAPIEHPCNTGTHYCWQSSTTGATAMCVITAGTNDFTCKCPAGYTEMHAVTQVSQGLGHMCTDQVYEHNVGSGSGAGPSVSSQGISEVAGIEADDGEGGTDDDFEPPPPPPSFSAIWKTIDVLVGVIAGVLVLSTFLFKFGMWRKMAAALATQGKPDGEEMGLDSCMDRQASRFGCLQINESDSLTPWSQNTEAPFEGKEELEEDQADAAKETEARFEGKEELEEDQADAAEETEQETERVVFPISPFAGCLTDAEDVTEEAVIQTATHTANDDLEVGVGDDVDQGGRGGGSGVAERQGDSAVPVADVGTGYL